MDKRLIILVVVYILCVLALAVFGIAGSSDENERREALRYFSMQDIETGRSYFLHGVIPATLYRISVIAVLLLLALRGAQFLRRITSRFRRYLIRTLLSLCVILLVLSAVRLPFVLYSDFYRNLVFGLMKMDLYTWLSRYVAATAIFIITSAVSLSLIAVLIQKIRLYAVVIPAALFVMSLAYTAVYPRFFTPLFYETERLPENELRGRIVALLGRAGVDVSDVYVLNKSKYRESANAYMTGFGADRRIYLYDTLLLNFTDDEILTIVAHELCHYTEEHMLLGILLMSLSLMAFLPVMNRIITALAGVDIRDLFKTENHPVLLILIIIMLFISRPAFNAVSRYIEERADAYELRLAGRPETAIAMTVRLAKTNRKDILPNPVYSWFYHTHPADMDRIRHAARMKK